MRSACAIALLSPPALVAACAAIDGATARTGDDASEAAGMVRLPGGTFLAGERTGPRRDEVTYLRVRPFLLDATEVTVASYSRCVEAGKCKPAAATVEWDTHRERELTAWSALQGGPRRPRGSPRELRGLAPGASLLRVDREAPARGARMGVGSAKRRGGERLPLGGYGADARSLSAAARLLELPTRRNSDLGFRCAKSL